MMNSTRRGLTIVEVAVATLAVAFIAAAAVPMSQDVRDRHNVVVSKSNLRNLAMVQANYAAEWNDRQFTLTTDHLARYGESLDTALETMGHVDPHPPIDLGWNADEEHVEVASDDAEMRWLFQVISFNEKPRGWFRALNVERYTQYLNGRFYDRGLYAPKDTAAMAFVEGSFEGAPYAQLEGTEPSWSSYCWSPAGLVHPDVMAMGDDAAFKDPFSINAGFRSPAMSQCRFPDLKSNICEHHWLQNRPVWATDCQPDVDAPNYGGCQPYLFNHYAHSEPATLFYDGHVGMIKGVDALEHDERVRKQGGTGLWLRAPGGASDGYYESDGADLTRASWHIYTRGGIAGRDLVRN